MTQIKITLNSVAFNVGENETVLQAALRQGVNLKFSCGGGSCHACLMKCISGDIPQAAQAGLPGELVECGYFLPCICHPINDMALSEPDSLDFQVDGVCVDWRTDAFGGLLEIDLVRLLPGLIEGMNIVLFHDNAHYEAVVVGLPEHNYYLTLRMALPEDTGIDWHAHLGKTVRVKLASADPRDPVPSGNLVPSPDPALWELIGAKRVRAALETFYDMVFADPRLSPFFSGVTKERVIGKQFSFMEKLMTGQKVYFGDNPRNSHHWMVISENLFDYRESLMRKALQSHGVIESQIERWMRLEGFYRGDIIKSRPFPRMLDGIEQPLDGFEEAIIDVGTLCDHCGAEVNPGDIVIFHRRLGSIACKNCGTSSH